MLNFIKCFFCIYWGDHVIFIICFDNVVDHTEWFVNGLHLQNKSQFIVVYHLFSVLLNVILKISSIPVVWDRISSDWITDWITHSLHKRGTRSMFSSKSQTACIWVVSGSEDNFQNGRSHTNECSKPASSGEWEAHIDVKSGHLYLSFPFVKSLC